MFIFVVPGMIAYAMHHDPLSAFKLPIEDGVVQSSGTLAAMVQYLLPPGIRGFIAAGILSALMSSLSSVFNSCSTLITWDIYKKYNPNKSEKSLVRFGQIATGFLVLSGMMWIPFQESLSAGGLFTYLQSVQALISPPIAAVFLLGLFIKRINSQGAMAALYTGAVLGIIRLLSEINGFNNILTQPLFLHFALYLFIICSLVMLAVSYLTPEPDYDKIKNLIYQKSDPKNKNYFSQDALLSYFLVLVVLIIWYVFS